MGSTLEMEEEKQISIPTTSTLSDQLEEDGRRIAQTNPRWYRFALMLSHPEFEAFFDENFSDWDSCKRSIMLLKGGSYLKKQIQALTGEDTSGHQLISALNSAIENRDTRTLLSNSMLAFMSGEEFTGHTVTHVSSPP